MVMHGILLSCLGSAPSCYLELLDKLQKQICGTVGPSLPSSFVPLVHRQYVASLSLFYRYYIQWLIQAVLDIAYRVWAHLLRRAQI